MIEAAIVVHVAMGATWALATLVVAVTGWARPLWLKLMLSVALLNLAAGVYLWHALHAGPWGAAERLLATGTFCAFVALGMQVAVTFTLSSGARRLETAGLWVYRLTALLVVAAASAMIVAKS